MILSMIRQELIGIAQLSIPFIIAYLFFPKRLLSPKSIVILSIVTGLCVSAHYYHNTKNITNILQYEPSGYYLKSLQKEINTCGLDPKRVRLRYSYSDDNIAQTMFNTVTIDPMLWQDIESDPQSVNAKNIITQSILPTLPEEKKVFQSEIKEVLSPAAQRFIFRHELGHVFYNYSLWWILIAGITSAITVCIGLITVKFAIPNLGSIGALILALLVSASTDLFLGFSRNVFFTAREEKKADLFATQFSSKKEIEAAADCFERYEVCANRYRAALGISKHIPTVILSGHPDGQSRSAYLREIARTKT